MGGSFWRAAGLTALTATGWATAPALALPAPTSGSGVTGIAIAGTQDVGTFNGIAYSRIWGTVSGVVAPNEKVEGLAAQPKDPQGNFAYTSPFEIIAPTKPGNNSTILIESENRGTPIMHNYLDAIAATGPAAKATYPKGLGNGFLQQHGISYGRVSWQTGISPGVPAKAEGVGEVIIRDFARFLGGDRSHLTNAATPNLGHYTTRIFGGISQSSWFVNAFVAEGFNADPKTGARVFGGVIAVDGTGNWLALNQLAAAHKASQAPYVLEDAAPLQAHDILKRPKSDPLYIDIANYTDFYRVHASLTDTAKLPARMWRYDWPGPHHPVTSEKDATATFAATRPGGACNDGHVVPLNPISYAPYLRTVVVELAHRLGSHDVRHAHALPPSVVFKLGPAPTDTAHLNPMRGVTLKVPMVDHDANPVGGVRYPETAAPFGKPEPVSLPPVITSAITGTCGNIGEWQPFTEAQLKERYGDQAGFLERYGQAADQLIKEGYLLASEKAEMMATAARHYMAPDKP